MVNARNNHHSDRPSAPFHSTRARDRRSHAGSPHASSATERAHGGNHGGRRRGRQGGGGEGPHADRAHRRALAHSRTRPRRRARGEESVAGDGRAGQRAQGRGRGASRLVSSLSRARVRAPFARSIDADASIDRRILKVGPPIKKTMMMDEEFRARSLEARDLPRRRARLALPPPPPPPSSVDVVSSPTASALPRDGVSSPIPPADDLLHAPSPRLCASS